MSHNQVPSSQQILQSVIIKHGLSGETVDVNAQLAEMLRTTSENIEEIRAGKEELSFSQGARLARIMDKIPLMYLGCVGFNLAKREKNTEDQELWYMLLYRNTNIGYVS